MEQLLRQPRISPRKTLPKRTLFLRPKNAAFSLLELVIVITIIGIIAAFALPTITGVTDGAKLTATAADLKNFGKAFYGYRMLEGSWPPDSHRTVPVAPNITSYVPPQSFEKETPISGYYNWEGPDSYPYAGVSIEGSSAPFSTFLAIDEMIDDGDLSTGSFQETPNGRFTWIIEKVSP
ncbi:MAG: prepilin-type N-terminal cleavage/methylation domain-containing protein [Verrucomicrobiota bacterium]